MRRGVGSIGRRPYGGVCKLLLRQTVLDRVNVSQTRTAMCKVRSELRFCAGGLGDGLAVIGGELVDAFVGQVMMQIKCFPGL